MNKWKIAFWKCLIVLIAITGLSIYSIINQGVTITYMKEGYADTESDLDNLAKFISQTDMSKAQIKASLRLHHLFEQMDFNKDTIPLDRVTLIFRGDKLSKVINHGDMH